MTRGKLFLTVMQTKPYAYEIDSMQELKTSTLKLIFMTLLKTNIYFLYASTVRSVSIPLP